MSVIKFVPKQSFPLGMPVKAPVNGAGSGVNEYDRMDISAIKKGYANVFSSGWIATMGDEYHNPARMLEQLDREEERIKQRAKLRGKR